MNVYQGPSTVVTDLNWNTQGEKLAATDLKKSSDKCGIWVKLKGWVKCKVSISRKKKKITGWLRWFAFKFVTNYSLTKNKHPKSMMGKQTSLWVPHLEKLVKEVEVQHQSTTKAPGLSACCKCCWIFLKKDPVVSLVGAEEEVSRIRPKLQLECLCFYLFFFFLY